MDIAQLGIVVKTQGVKEAERGLKGLEKQGADTERRASSLAATFGRASKAIGAAALAGFGVAAAGAALYIKNSIEAERVQAQLAARIKSTGMAARLSLGDLNKMAGALQAVTTFDDESIGEVQARLLTFTKVARENFQRATEATLDLSTALGGDLNSAALQVGKALNDPVLGVTALARAGVQFSDAQKGVIKNLVETGRTADAQRIILRELETQMGGSARAARDTLGGALQALRNSFDNLLEGDSGGLRGTKEAVEGFNRALNDPGLKAGLGTAFTGMINLANGAVQLIAKLGSAASALREFYGANSGKGLGNLINRKIELENDIAKLERRPGLYGGANDPIAKLLGLPGDSAAKIAAKKRELDEVEGLITRAYRLGDWQEGRVTIGAGMAGVNGRPTAGGMATLDAGTGKVTASKAQAAAVREATVALRDYASEEEAIAAVLARADDERFQAIESWAALSAELGGPLKMAEFEHIQRMEEIQRLGSMAGVVADEIAAAKAKEAAAYREATEAMIEQQRVQSNPEVIQLMDEFRMGSVNAFTDIVTGAKSAKDAFRDFFDDLAAQITKAIANKWMEQLFGGMGSSGSGTAGGDWLGSLFGAFFGGMGGGFAKGGYTGDGPAHEVAGVVHRGEYVIPADQFKRLRSGGSGEPEARSTRMGGGGGGVTQNISFMVEGRIDRSTQSQVAARAYGAASRASARNR